MPRYSKFLKTALALALLRAIPAEPQQAPAPELLPLGTRLTRSSGERFAVPLTAGQFIKVVVLQTGSDVIVTLIDPQQRVLMTSDLPNGAFGNETVAAVAQSDGEYAVEVQFAKPNAKGAYRITLDAVRSATPDDRELSSAYQGLMQAHLLRKKRESEARRDAAGLLDRIRPSFTKAKDRYSEALTLTIRGTMLAESGDIKGALRYAEDAAALFHEAGDLSGEATGRSNIGGTLDVLGEPQRAREAYLQALLLVRQIGDRQQEASLLNNMAKLDAASGNWQSALDGYQQALALASDSGDIRTQGLLTHNIGIVHSRLGDLDEALSMFQQAIVLRRSTNDKRGEGETLQAIANSYASGKQPGKALEYFEQAIQVQLALGDRRKEAEIRIYLGRTYADLGRLTDGEKSIRQALDGERAVQDRRNTALAMLYLGDVLIRENQPVEALEQTAQALADFRAIGDRASESMALESIARAEANRGNLAAARDRMREALLVTEDNRTHTASNQLRASFFATQQDSYAFYIDLLMRLGDPAAALEASERSRARSMLDMLSEAGSAIREGVDSKLLEREREITNTLNAKGARLLALGADTPRAITLKQEIQELERDYQDTEAAIRKNSPRYAALTQPSPLSVSRIQHELLDDHTLLLEYSLGEQHSYLWIVSKNALHTCELPARAAIEAQVASVIGLLTARGSTARLETPADRQKRIASADAALPAALRELSHMIMEAAESALGGNRLVIVPDGALQRLPFSILPVEGRPLIVFHETSVLPSASALSVLRQEIASRAPATKTLAVFADPVFDRTDPRALRTVSSAAPPSHDATRILEHLSGPGTSPSHTLKIPRLPYTAQEAERILSVSGKGSNLKAIGFQASRALAVSGQLSAYRYLHFATHGYLDTERPSLSALVLSQIDETNQPVDGFLRVNDIYNTRLTADLVVLSACQTGLGKEVHGEGLMGLTRAFLYAGAPRVIVSLWNVNDRATAQLMTTLYREMLREGKRPSAALRDAQLEMRKQKQWESPYYWAAFVQHGEWR